MAGLNITDPQTIQLLNTISEHNNGNLLGGLDAILQRGALALQLEGELDDARAETAAARAEATKLAGALEAMEGAADTLKQQFAQVSAKLSEATGETAPAVAVGILVDRANRAAAVEAELSALREERRLEKRTAMFEQACREGRLTPAQIARAQAGNWFPEPEALADWIASMPMAAPPLREPMKKPEKSFSEMSRMERHELAASDPALYEQMKREAERKGD